ncbi:MAG: DNA internalization-related competence protein ComEC/Rec2 [Ignavibacteriaceae bacterium]
MKDFHVIKITLLFIFGILLQPLFKINLILFSGSALIILILVFSSFKTLKNKEIIISFYLLLLVVILGSFRASTVNKNSFLSENIYKIKNFTAYGPITRVELKRDIGVEFSLFADSVLVNNKVIGKNIKLVGKIRDEDKVKSDSIYNSISPGNFVSITGTYAKGREVRNPGEFDYDRYLRERGISGIITSYNINDFKIISSKTEFFPNKIFQIRKSIYRDIVELQSEQTASLLKSLLLADRSDIDFETKTAFINSGVIHVLAVSGLHTGFIILFLLLIFGRFNIYFRSFAAILGLLIFMCITGLPVSVFRASVMAIVIIIAFMLNRSTNLFNSLALAALIILIVNPYEIYSAGFQLSFSAVLSIGVIFPLFQNQIKKFNIKNNFLKYFILLLAVSISVEIGTLPVTVAYFRKLSLIAPLTNLVVIPLIGLILLVAIGTLLISTVFPFIAGVYAAANDFFTFILFKFIKTSGNLEYSFIWIRNFRLYDAFIFYTLLIFFIFFFIKFKSTPAKILLFSLSILNFYIFSSYNDKELFHKNEFNLLMVDVGQGDSFLLQMPDGKTALVDAGPVSEYFDTGDYVLIPLLNYLGINKIDCGIISHMDLDHYGGFVSLIHNERITRILKPSFDSTDINDIKFEKYLNENKIPYSYYHKEIMKFDNLRFYSLFENLENNYSKNDRSGVIRILFGKNSFLLTGDAESKREKILLKDYKDFLKSDILKVGHHGSSSGSSIKFLKIVDPGISLLSAGIQNKFGHPSAEILNRLKSIKSKIFRTDKQGAVLFRSTGNSIYVVNWKND